MNRLRETLGGFLFSGIAFAVAALFFFAWLANQVFRGAAHGFDTAARAFVQSIASGPLTFIMRGFTLLGTAPSLVVLLILVVVLFRRAGRERAAWLFLVTMAGALVLDLALKQAFHRPRPSPFFNTPVPRTYSFPSGHALESCCFFCVLAAMLSAREPRRGVRIALWIAAPLIAALIGFSRIYLGVHYATDVIAGYLAAIVWVYTVALVDRFLRRRRSDPPRGAPPLA